MGYQGHIATILAGQGGFNGNDNYDAIPVTNLIDAQNIRFDGDSWRKAGGLDLYDANAIANANAICVGGHDWWPTTAIQKQVTAWSDGKVYKEVSGDVDSVELVNSLTALANAPAIFVECGREVVTNNRKLLMFCKGQAPYVLNANGTTMTPFANNAANGYSSIDWTGSIYPMGGVFHDQRVVAWYQDTIYFSDISNHTNFQRYDVADSNSDVLPTFDIAPGQGEEIRACYPMGSTRLYVFKYPTGIYWVDTSYVTSYYMPVTTVRTDIGIAGPRAITRVGSMGTWFIGSDGHIYDLALVDNPDVDLADASITQRLKLNKWIKDNVNLNRLLWAQLIYDSNRKEVIAAFSYAGVSTANGRLLVIDVQDPNNPRIAYDDRGTYYNALWHSKEASTLYRNLYCAGTGGNVYKMNRTARTIGTSTGYSGALRIPDTDFSWYSSQVARMEKRFDWLELIFNTTDDTALYIDTYIDGLYYQTYSFTQPSAGGALGSFILGTDSFGATGQDNEKIKIGGIGTRFGFRIRNSASGADFNISRVIVYFDVLGTKGEN